MTESMTIWRTIYIDSNIICSRDADELYRMLVLYCPFYMKQTSHLLLGSGSSFSKKLITLGHVKRPGKLELAYRTTDAIFDLKPPCKITSLKSFCSLCHVYWRFVSNFAAYLHCLRKTLRKLGSRTFHVLTQ